VPATLSAVAVAVVAQRSSEELERLVVEMEELIKLEGTCHACLSMAVLPNTDMSLLAKATLVQKDEMRPPADEKNKSLRNDLFSASSNARYQYSLYLRVPPNGLLIWASAKRALAMEPIIRIAALPLGKAPAKDSLHKLVASHFGDGFSFLHEQLRHVRAALSLASR
jgi:hypothetical protein